MNKHMNKVLAATVAGVTLLAGAAGAQTAQEILEQAQKASSEVSNMTVDLVMNGQASMTVAGSDGQEQSVPVGGKLEMGVYTAMGMPMSVYTTGNMTLNLMGFPINREITDTYVVITADGMDTYTLDDTDPEAPAWMHIVQEGTEYGELVERSLSGEMSNMQLPMDYVLAEATQEIDGTECYVITAQMAASQMVEYVKSAMALAGNAGQEQMAVIDELLAKAGPYVDGLVVSFEEYVAVDTCLPVQMTLDLNDSSWGPILDKAMELLASQLNMAGTSLSIDDASMSFTFDYYEEPGFEIPQEALNAPVTPAEELAAQAQGLIESQM
ncbi:MAG: hypothetical protein Q4B59_04645 [Lachnospiraceae bacterium]|nr:hypothetical protein [Lachnospiraceae bacterium]